MLEAASSLAMPLVAVLAACVMLFGRRDYFAAFCQGAREGLETAVRLFPTLCALMVAIAMLNASGAVALISRLLAPLADTIGIPTDILPLPLTRPFSGSASTAALDSLLGKVGADSFSGLCASVIFGSSDTLVYVIGVYFSSVGIRSTRSAFPIALAVMLFCIFFSCFLCRLCFT